MRQPWAGAIIHHGKSPENRTRNIAGSYLGPVAIHVGLRHDYATSDRYVEIAGGLDQHSIYGYGAFIGVVDLVDVHTCWAEEVDQGTVQCCGSPWAEFEFVETRALCEVEPQRLGTIVHLVLANPRPLPEPILARGMLGLWTPPAEVLDQLQAVV